MENEETDPLLEHEEKDDDDDDDSDATNPFQPGGSSTPGEENSIEHNEQRKRERPGNR